MQADIGQVKTALGMLYNVKETTSAQRKEANRWLEQFQKTPLAWNIADQLIRQPDSTMEQRLFAAQTFRQKIEYDIKDLNREALLSLRDSLLGLLNEFKRAKNISTQLSIAVADLAIQMNDGWSDPVGFMIDSFGGKDGFPVLMEFLMVLPEELSCNTKITLESNEYLAKDHTLLKSNAVKVLQLMFQYMQEFGSDEDARFKILQCICSWLRSGSIPVEIIESSSLVTMAFEVLQDPSTFDIGVDIICELILISARRPRNEKNEAIFQSIYPLLTNLVPFLKNNIEDGEIVRGICRILVEAGEGFADLVVANHEAFGAILEGLLLCSANEDLEIVKITMNVWFVISEHLTGPENESKRAAFFPIYRALVDILIGHMKYPADNIKVSAQERDEFREFRHDMGDVMKDCVRVLGEEAALAAPYSLLQKYFGLDVNATTQIPWQDIEAPLFSLRVMCREVSEKESKYIPQIMTMLPSLPPHPKVKYAAILVIGRYAQWTNNNPSMLTYQLDYVSKGFQDNQETTIAAAHAFRDLCKYCNKHLVDYLGQLQPFYQNSLSLVVKEDKKEMSEAVSHLLAAVPIENLSQALELFCVPVAKRIHQAISTESSLDVKATLSLNDEVDELGNLLTHIEIETPSTAHPVILFLESIWPVMDVLISKHGASSVTAEPIARCLRKILEATKTSFAPLLPHLLTKLVHGFESSKLSCYLWIAAKCVRVFGADEAHQQDVRVLLESLTNIVFQMVQHPEIPSEEPEIVVEEYHYLLSQFLDSAPFLFLASNLAPPTFQCALFCIKSSKDEPSVSAILKFIIDLFDLTKPARATLVQTSNPSIIPLMQEHGTALISALLNGLIHTFSRDRGLIEDVAEIIHILSLRLGPQPVFMMVSECVSQFPKNEMSDELQTAFLVKIQSILQASQPGKLATHLREFAAGYARRNLINSRR